MKKYLLPVSLLLVFAWACKPGQPVTTTGTTTATQTDTSRKIIPGKTDTLVKTDTVKTNPYEGHNQAPDHKGKNQTDLDSIKREKQKGKN